MSDERVRTHVLTDDGAVTFHDYFHQLACAPAARGFEYACADAARVSDDVIAALHAADLEAVILCPANPYHSIRPILELDGMKELRRRRGAPVIAVTPIVGGKALAGSAGKIMRDLGREPSARAVAGEYRRLVDGFVLDSEDAAMLESVRSLDDRVALANEVLEFARGLRARRAAEVQ